MTVKTFPTTEHLKEYFSGREKLLGMTPVDVEGAEFHPDGWIYVPYKDGGWFSRVHEIAVLVFFHGKEDGKNYAVTMGNITQTNHGTEKRYDKVYFVGVPSYISKETIKRLLKREPSYHSRGYNSLLIEEIDKIPEDASRERIKPFDRVVNQLLGGGSLDKVRKARMIECLKTKRDIMECLT